MPAPWIESTPVFVDGFGRRVVRVTRDAAPVELLHLDPTLAQHPGFAAALRARVARVSSLRLTSYARAASVETDDQGGVALAYEYVKGWRLADLLDVAEAENLTFDIGVVMLLLRQLLPTATMLSTQARDTTNGALGPEHLLLTPQGRLVLTDYVFGSAIDTLGWPPERLWSALRVATPPEGVPARSAAARRDVVQVGVTVLSLVAGRRLRDDEFPERLEVLVGSARQRTPHVVDAPLSDGLRTWLTRALQRHPRGFASLFDAQMAMEQLLASDTALLAQPAELEAAMARVERLMPAFELPEPPAEAPVNLLDMPAPAHDWSLDAVAFDSPAVAVPAAETAAAPVEAEAEVDPLVAAITGFKAPEPEGLPGDGPRADASASEPLPAAPPPIERVPAAAGGLAAMADEPLSAPPRSDDRAPAAVRFGRPESVLTDEAPDVPPTVPEAVPWWRSPGAVAAMLALVVVQAALLGWQLSRPSESLAGEGELVVQSRPEGAQVSIDGQERGFTPLTIRVAPGTHVLQLRVGSAEPRVIPLSIRPGVQTAQYVELQGVSSTGVLEVRSEPSRARVTIDGQARGSTPLTLRDVAPGDYQVVIERSGWKSTQTVRVEPGTTAQLVVPLR